MTPADHTAQSTTKRLTAAELAHRLGDPTLVVVDVRPTAAYNGWRLQGEARGGHLPGAAAFPLKWLDLIAPAELPGLLAAKGIAADKTIVAYGYTAAEAATFVNKLAELGYADLATYDDGLAAWAADGHLPLERLPRYERLVPPGWVSRLIQGEPVENYTGKRHALFHVNFGVPEEYAESHLPGAFYLDTNDLEAPDTWNRRSPAELEAALLAHGITPDTTVLLYGRDTVGDPDEKWPGRNAGQISAFRAGLILMYAGVKDVRMIDGGYDAWVNEGFELETTPHQPTPASAFGAVIPARPEYIVDIEEAKDILANSRGEVVSIRSWEEHVGNVSGYNYIGPAGRIAGSVWGNCGSDAYHMQEYRNVDNTMRPYPEIAANWRQAGITADKRIAFHCGTGWRASETFFYAYLMGWERMAVYDGGWFEWSADPANPVEVGMPDELCAPE